MAGPGGRVAVPRSWPEGVRWAVRQGGALGLLLAVVAASGGCGDSAALSLDRPLAESTLSQALTAWRDGKSPADLKAQSPSIVCGDPRWEAGTRLRSFTLHGPATDDGVNLHQAVELELEAPGSLPTSEIVTFVVGTHPILTVFPQ